MKNDISKWANLKSCPLNSIDFAILKKSDHNLITLRIDFIQNLFELKNKSSIYQYEFNGGVAQLVRARDS